MAITHPLFDSWAVSFGGPESTKTVNVGSGANRRADIIIGWNVNARGAPSGFRVGPAGGTNQVATVVGSQFDSAIGGGRWLHLEINNLTMTGAQECAAIFTASPNFDSGASFAVILVSQGDSAIVKSGLQGLAEAFAGVGGGTITRTLTAPSGGVAVIMAANVSSPAGGPTAPGSTVISGASNPVVAQAARANGTGASQSLQLAYSSTFQANSIAFALAEQPSAALLGTVLLDPDDVSGLLTLEQPSAVLGVSGGLDVALARGLMESSSSALLGGVALQSAAPQGLLAPLPSSVSVTLRQLNALATGVTVPVVTVSRLDDGVQVARAYNVTSHASTASVVVADPAISAGTWYMVAGWTLDGQMRFQSPVQAG